MYFIVHHFDWCNKSFTCRLKNKKTTWKEFKACKVITGSVNIMEFITYFSYNNFYQISKE